MGLGKTLIVIALFAILSRDYTEYGLDWSLHDERQSDTVQNTPQLDPVEHVQGDVLIVVPADLIPMWKEELRVRLKTPPKVLIYHGNKDHGGSIGYTPKELAVADIVITSYETLRSDYDDAKVSTESFEDCMQTMIRGYYPNLVIYWRVLVLDEAHKIANDETGVNKAINSVRALFRFPLTGTPFLNEYTDILSQLQLMRIPPFQNRGFSDEYFLLPPLPKETAHRASSGTLEGVLCLVMRACSVRLDCGDTFNGRVIGKRLRECGKVHWHDLLPNERAAQDEVKQLWDKEYKPEDDDGAIDSDNSLKRMTFARLAAVHPECAKAGYGEKGAVQLDAEAIEGGAFERLPLGEGTLPPVSNKTKRTMETKRADFRKKLVNGAWASSRLNLVIDIIKYYMSNKKRKEKIVVFSEFLCTLDALAVGLQESELQSILRFDGTVGIKERKRVVHEFENGAERHVLLITSGSGGLGRSFIAADCVIHIQPCYNPSLTYQTTNCVVRYPQDKMVYIHYLYANDSIELRVNELRNRKRGKAAGLFDPDDEVLQSIEEIRSWEEDDLEMNVSLCITTGYLFHMTNNCTQLINSVAFAMASEDDEGDEQERGRKKSRPEVRGEKDERQNRC
jgi:SNF2 family DNA or RNA helicase